MRNKRVPVADLGRAQRQVYAAPVQTLQGPQFQYNPDSSGLLKGLQQFVDFGTQVIGERNREYDAQQAEAMREAKQRADKVNAIRAETGLDGFRREYDELLKNNPKLLTDDDEHEKAASQLREKYFSDIDSDEVLELVDIRLQNFTASTRDSMFAKQEKQRTLKDASSSVLTTSGQYDALLKQAKPEQRSAVLSQYNKDIRAKLEALNLTDEEQEEILLNHMEEVAKDESRRSAIYEAFMNDPKLSDLGRERVRTMKLEDDKRTKIEKEMAQSAFFAKVDPLIKTGRLTRKLTQQAVADEIITAEQERSMFAEQQRQLERRQDQARAAAEKAAERAERLKMYMNPATSHMLTEAERFKAYQTYRENYIRQYGEKQGVALLQQALRSRGLVDYHIQGTAAAAVNAMTGVLTTTKDRGGNNVTKLPLALEEFTRNTNAWELFNRGQLAANLKDTDIVPVMTYMSLVKYGGKSEADAFNIVSRKDGLASKLTDIPVKEQQALEAAIREEIKRSYGASALTYSDVPATGVSVALSLRRSGLSKEQALEMGKQVAKGMYHADDKGKVLPYAMVGRHASVETLNRNSESLVNKTAKTYGVDPEKVSLNQFGGFVVPSVDGWIKPDDVIRWDQFAAEGEQTFDGKKTVTGERRSAEREKAVQKAKNQSKHYMKNNPNAPYPPYRIN